MDGDFFLLAASARLEGHPDAQFILDLAVDIIDRIMAWFLSSAWSGSGLKLETSKFLNKDSSTLTHYSMGQDSMEDHASKVMATLQD